MISKTLGRSAFLAKKILVAGDRTHDTRFAKSEMRKILGVRVVFYRDHGPITFSVFGHVLPMSGQVQLHHPLVGLFLILHQSIRVEVQLSLYVHQPKLAVPPYAHSVYNQEIVCLYVTYNKPVAGGSVGKGFVVFDNATEAVRLIDVSEDC
uniref:Uncharacterized protein n=1 Tax=Cacopsylla melanoneura TaxID=428564 RepID=A0A8D8RMY8_9HEMI